MPLYEYHCEACGKAFEQIVRFSDADLKPSCPFCGADNASKTVTAAASFGASSFESSHSSGSSCSPRGRFT